MNLLGSTKRDVDQDKDGEDVAKLESVEAVLVHYNLVNNNCQNGSKVWFTCSLTMLNTVNTEFSSIEVWFTAQNSKPLEIEDNVNIAIIIV